MRKVQVFTGNGDFSYSNCTASVEWATNVEHGGPIYGLPILNVRSLDSREVVVVFNWNHVLGYIEIEGPDDTLQDLPHL